MAGKIHTDSEALYAIRSAITKFAGEIQESKNDFSQCFEQMNCQIDDHIRHLRTHTEALYEEKKSIEDEIAVCEEKKVEAERNSNRNGSTDSFVCRNEACGSRMMLKVLGDTVPCKSCGGTMHRVFTGGEYNKYNTEAFQAEEKINQLRNKLEEIQKQININEDAISETSAEYLRFRSHQDSVLSLLTFSGGEDPETTASFIEKALSSLGDYHAINLGMVEPSSEDEVQKKNIGDSGDSKQKNLDSAEIAVQELLTKESLTDKDREALRNAIIDGTVGEREIRTIGARVRAKYEQFLQKRREEFDYLQNKKRELAIRFNNASSDDERHQVAVEAIFLKEKEAQYKEKYGNSSVIKNVLETYRSIGPKENDPGQKYEKGFLSSSQPVIEAIDSIREYIPTEWVEKSNEVPIITKHVNRGYFNVKDGKPTIALSTAGSGMQRCAFHEMGHFFEHLYPEIRKLEYQFYNRRTAGEELRWLGAGYSRSEVTRYDNFVEPYMGKDYGNTETSGYEIFSMGMESIFANSYDLSRDTEYQDLMLGILASV